MSTLNDLGNDSLLQDGVDFNNMPEQGGGRTPPPQPGTYRFRLPETLGPEQFKKVDSTDFGPRVQVKFDENAPLLIVQAPASAIDRVNTPFETSLSNVPRNRARKGQPAQNVSDADYLLRALGITERPATNRAYAEVLIAAAKEGREFTADIEWSWRCNDKRDAYFTVEDPDNPGQTKSDRIPLVDEAGNAIPDKFRQGCGKGHYQQNGRYGQVGKVNVAAEDQPPVIEYPLYITCQNQECQAVVRGFANLTRFR